MPSATASTSPGGTVTPPSQRSIRSLSSSPAVHTAGTPAQKQSSSRVRKEKLDSR